MCDIIIYDKEVKSHLQVISESKPVDEKAFMDEKTAEKKNNGGKSEPKK